jgi:RNA polymerase sigma factor (sigma-70 family)
MNRPEVVASVPSTIGSQSGDRRGDAWSVCLRQVAEIRDLTAFSRLLRHFSPLIKAFALSGSSLSAANADELVQEVMIKVWQQAGAFDAQKAAPTIWIYTMDRNCRTDIFRRLQKFDTPISAEEICPVSDSEELFTSVQQMRDATRVPEMLKQLPREQSQILVKVYMESKSHSEVAEQLDLPLGTVKSRVRLAMNKLQLIAER